MGDMHAMKEALVTPVLKLDIRQAKIDTHSVFSFLLRTLRQQ
jgi:hypothetical protein